MFQTITTLTFKLKNAIFLIGFLLFGIGLHAQISIDCKFPFVPTPCQGWIDSSPNMVDISTDCAAGYTLTIGDPVLVSGFGSCPGATYTVTYTATDNCQGQSASCSQTWVIENDGPTLTCPMDLYLDCGDPYNQIYIDYWLNSVQADVSCLLGSNQFNTYNPNWLNGPCPSGFQTVTFFVTDACGRSATCSATVFVLDHDEPELLQAAEDHLAVCSYNTPHDFQDWLNSHGGAIAEDACSNVSWSTIPANPQLPLACSEVEVTFVATDGCGWSVSTTASFALIDCHPPVITGQPNDMSVECTDDVDAALQSWLNSNGGATAEDACGTNIFWMTDPMDPELSDDCGNTGSVTVIFIAKDDCGNASSTDPATFSVVDTTPPEFTSVPADATIECVDDVEFGTPEAEDACGAVTITYMDMTLLRVEGGFSGSQEVPPSGSAGIGSVMGTYKTSTGTLDIEVSFEGLEGNTTAAHIHNAPVGSNGGVVVALPIPTGVTAGNFSFSIDLDANQALELKDGNYYINIHTEAVPSGEIRAQLFVKPCIGSSTRTWTATDECGNTATASQTINFADTEAPVPNEMPADITISCGDPVEFADDPTWTDNCDTDIFTSVEDSTEDPGCPTIIVHVRVWSAIDDCGNLGTVKQRIFVQDFEGPEFTFVPEDTTVECDADVVFGTPTAEDNCGGPVTITFEDEVTGSGCDVTTTRTWTATDECGNTSTASQSISAIDNEPPVFTYVPPTPDIDCMVPPFDWEDPIAEDNCGTVTLTYVEEAPNGSICDEGAAYVRKYTATDECGNIACVDVVIWVNADEGAPVFTFVPEDLTFYCVDGEPMIPDAEAVDDCDPDVTITYEDEFNTDPDDCGNGYGYDIVRTWTATDHCGNTTTAVTLAWVKGPFSFGGGNNGIASEGAEVAADLFELSPNPASERLNIAFSSEIEQRATISVFNILGKTVYNEVENAVQGLNNTSLTVDHLASGTYLISIEFGNKIMTKKFVKR